MITEMIALSAFILLVIGGPVAAMVKFTLHGKVSSSVSNRVSSRRLEMLEAAAKPPQEKDHKNENNKPKATKQDSQKVTLQPKHHHRLAPNALS